MPRVKDLGESKYLKKEDVEDGKLVTISGYKQEDVSMESEAPRLKYVLYFHGLEKGLVLNVTNGQLIQMYLGTDDLDEWKDKQIVLYNDPTVSFAGKLTGGIRVKKHSADPGRQIPTDPVGNDEIPYVKDGPPLGTEADLAGVDEIPEY